MGLSICSIFGEKIWLESTNLRPLWAGCSHHAWRWGLPRWKHPPPLPEHFLQRSFHPFLPPVLFPWACSPPSLSQSLAPAHWEGKESLWCRQRSTQLRPWRKTDKLKNLFRGVIGRAICWDRKCKKNYKVLGRKRLTEFRHLFPPMSRVNLFLSSHPSSSATRNPSPGANIIFKRNSRGLTNECGPFCHYSSFILGKPVLETLRSFFGKQKLLASGPPSLSLFPSFLPSFLFPPSLPSSLSFSPSPLLSSPLQPLLSFLSSSSLPSLLGPTSLSRCRSLASAACWACTREKAWELRVSGRSAQLRLQCLLGFFLAIPAS